MPDETWKPVVGFETLYEISNFGKIKSHFHSKETYLKPNVDRKGYAHVSLHKDGKMSRASVHRLVATAFIPNPLCLPQVNHIDGNKANNSVENLEWCTSKENHAHAIQNGLRNPKNHPSLSKAVDMFSKDGVFIKTFPSAQEAERQTGALNQNIQKCCAGKCGFKTAGGYVWKYHERKE